MLYNFSEFKIAFLLFFSKVLTVENFNMVMVVTLNTYVIKL